jgi:spore germination protein YaaH
MRLRTAALVVGGAAVVSLASPAAQPAAACSKAEGLSFHRKAGKPAGRLFWRTPKHGRFRVYRNKAIVGQTLGRSIRVAVKPGRKYVFRVRGIARSGALSGCTARLEERMRYYPPFRPPGLAVRLKSKSLAVLEWGRARPGDGHLYAYRIYRNGRVFKQVKKLRARVPLGSAPTILFAVAAADTRGRVGARSRTLRVVRGHRPPGVPGNLQAGRVTDSDVDLNWTKARAGSARVVGYRIYRDDALLGQKQGLSGTATNLAPATDYQFKVAAIDSYGYLSNGAGPAAVRTSMPPPTQGSAHAFLLATTDESFRDLQRHYRQIGVLYPTYFSCGADASIRGRDDPLVTRWSQIRRIAVVPRFDCQRPEVLHTILTDRTRRLATISGLVDLVRREGYEGINLDFEAGYAGDRDAYTNFASQLARRLHAGGDKLSLEVSAKYEGFETPRSAFYDYRGLGAVADYVFVMNWGWHWVTSTSGAPDDLYRFTKVADYAATMPNKSRYVLGMPMFGMDWPNGGGPANPGKPLEHADVMGQIAAVGATPIWDAAQGGNHFWYQDPRAVWHDVWYTNAASVGLRMRMTKARGLGLGLWRLGREDPAIWDDPLIAPGATWP